MIPGVWFSVAKVVDGCSSRAFIGHFEAARSGGGSVFEEDAALFARFRAKQAPRAIPKLVSTLELAHGPMLTQRQFLIVG